MKTLSEFNIYEELFTEDGLLKEGIDLRNLGKKIVSFFGGKSKDEKTAEEINNLDIDDKKNILSTQTVAIQSKDTGSIKAAKELSGEIANLKDKKPSLYLKRYMRHGEIILRSSDDINRPEFIIDIRDKIRDWGEDENNEKAIKMADELDALLNKKFPKDKKKAEEKVEQINTAIDNANNEGESNKQDKEGKSNKQDKEIKAEIQKSVTDEIKEEKDLLAPLAKAAKINGNELRNFVSNKITYQLTDNSTKKDGSNAKKAMKLSNVEEYTSGDNFKNDVLGMCIVVCGALISDNPEKFMKICEVLNIKDAPTADSLRKKIKKFNTNQANRAKAAKNKANEATSSKDSKK